MRRVSGYIPRMAPEKENLHREYWLAQANAVRLRVNLAWWLETLSAPLVILSVTGAAALLWLRREMPETGQWTMAAWIGGALVLLAIVCLVKAASRFERAEESLVRIEAAMCLRNALSAASEGVAPWPPPVDKTNAGLKWQWPRLLVPLIGALVLLTAGMWVPVTARQEAASSSPEEPQAWKQLAAELDYLTKEEVVDEKYLEETRKKLDELKSQEEEQWFSHSSLEATDTLKKAHRAETERVERELGKADKALASLEKNAASAGQAEKNRMMEEFEQALQGLQNGAMKPNPQLLEQMRQMDLKNLRDLTPEQLAQLRENLQKNANGLKGGQGEGGEWDDELLADGDGDGDGENGKPGDGPGKGGVDRGPGHDPGVLGKQRDHLETGEMAALEAKDLSNAAPGDLLELQDGEHDVDTSASLLTRGGDTEATGKGGDRVWRESLDPDEQRVLKRFFE
jgi:G3E family GTPase